jgi:SAM-dependent methyltransferase
MPRLYDDLAWLWPIWSPPEDYREESEAIADLAQRHAWRPIRALLDLGCGGGRNLVHFARRFEVTGLDVSEPMMAHARALSPKATFVRADMRSFDLGRTFDAVFFNDGIAHLTTLDNFRRAFACAARHVAPGGVLLAVAEFTPERFVQNRTEVVTRGDVVFVENEYDPDPRDGTFEVTALFLIRESGRLRLERDGWTCGLFPLDAWRDAAASCGLDVAIETGVAGLDGAPLIIGRRPS